MKTKLLSTLLILSFVSIGILGCKPESKKDTPQATFKSFITAAKAGKSPEIVFDYYDWDGIYQRRQEEYQKSGIVSVEELKSVMEGIFKDPAEFMKEKMLSQLDNTLGKDAPEYGETKQMLEKMSVEIGKRIEKTIKDERDKDKKRTFTLLEVTEDGDTAKGDFEIVEADGTKRQEKIELIKKDGQWFIVDLSSSSMLPAFPLQ